MDLEIVIIEMEGIKRRGIGESWFGRLGGFDWLGSCWNGEGAGSIAEGFQRWKLPGAKRNNLLLAKGLAE
jgi:hypothetical protein